MKVLLTLLVLLNFQSIATAKDVTDFKPGNFPLFGAPAYETGSGCDVGTSLTLDEGTILGKFAKLVNFVDGYCDLYIAPNERMYSGLEFSDYGCGSKLYTGSRMSDKGIVDIEIIDHRMRICDDIVQARIIVTETFQDSSASLYSTTSKK